MNHVCRREVTSKAPNIFAKTVSPLFPGQVHVLTGATNSSRELRSNYYFTCIPGKVSETLYHAAIQMIAYNSAAHISFRFNLQY